MIYHHRLNRLVMVMLVSSLAYALAACQTSTSLLQTIAPQTVTLEPAMTMPSVTLSPQPTAPSPSTGPIVGLGVLGDSNSDEYRADDNRGGEYAAVTFSWVELIAARRGLNLGPWGTWGEPRRTGFKYNWSRSGATVHDAIESGQHTGLAEQVASGEVSHVVIWIGTNDFATWNGKYQEIYDGQLDGEALQAKLDAITADITLAADTILRAGKVKLLLATIPERPGTPDVIRQFPDEAGRGHVNDAIRAANAQLMTMASSRGIAVVDNAALMQWLFQHVNTTGLLQIGREQISVFSRGNEPHNGQLDDDSGHPGTILSGLIANEIVIRPFDEQFGAGIPLLTDDEILQSAGLLNSQ